MNNICPLLLPVCLPLNEQHLLGQPVRCVSFLGIAIPQVFLTEWDGRQLWVRTDRTNGDKLLDSVLSSVLQQHCTHDQVLVSELPRMCLIRPNSADNRGEVDHDLWTFIAVQPFDSGFMNHVVLRLAGYEDVTASTRLE